MLIVHRGYTASWMFVNRKRNPSCYNYTKGIYLLLEYNNDNQIVASILMKYCSVMFINIADSFSLYLFSLRFFRKSKKKKCHFR